VLVPPAPLDTRPVMPLVKPLVTLKPWTLITV
jgi:hypothetical protein